MQGTATRAAPARATTESFIGKLLFAEVGRTHTGPDCDERVLKRRPVASFPVASSGMFTPSVMLAFLPPPVVRMDDYAGRGRIGVVLLDMPAIAVSVADNPRGCA